MPPVGATAYSKFSDLVGSVEDMSVVKPGQQRPPIPVPGTSRVVSAKIRLTRVVDWDGASQDIKQVLTAAFEAKDYLDCIKNLRAQNIDPLSYINSLDKVGSPLIF